MIFSTNSFNSTNCSNVSISSYSSNSSNSSNFSIFSNSIGKMTFQIIYQLSCFVGHPVSRLHKVKIIDFWMEAIPLHAISRNSENI